MLVVHFAAWHPSVSRADRARLLVALQLMQHDAVVEDAQTRNEDGKLGVGIVPPVGNREVELHRWDPVVRPLLGHQRSWETSNTQPNHAATVHDTVGALARQRMFARSVFTDACPLTPSWEILRVQRRSPRRAPFCSMSCISELKHRVTVASIHAHDTRKDSTQCCEGSSERPQVRSMLPAYSAQTKFLSSYKSDLRCNPSLCAFRVRVLRLFSRSTRTASFERPLCKVSQR